MQTIMGALKKKNHFGTKVTKQGSKCVNQIMIAEALDFLTWRTTKYFHIQGLNITKRQLGEHR